MVYDKYNNNNTCSQNVFCLNCLLVKYYINNMVRVSGTALTLSV